MLMFGCSVAINWAHARKGDTEMSRSCANTANAAFARMIVDAARRQVKRVVEAFGLADEERTGVYFCAKGMMSAVRDWLVNPLEVGKIINGKAEKYKEYCQEKTCRTREHFFSDGHRLSWQSRNPDEEQWGGAVICRDGADGFIILACSGLPELLDEVAMLCTAVDLGLLIPGEAEQLARISGSWAEMERVGFQFAA